MAKYILNKETCEIHLNNCSYLPKENNQAIITAEDLTEAKRNAKTICSSPNKCDHCL